MLKIIIPRAVIKNPSKEIIPPSRGAQPFPMLSSFNLLNSRVASVAKDITHSVASASTLNETKVKTVQRKLNIINPWAG